LLVLEHVGKIEVKFSIDTGRLLIVNYTNATVSSLLPKNNIIKLKTHQLYPDYFPIKSIQVFFPIKIKYSQTLSKMPSVVQKNPKDRLQ